MKYTIETVHDHLLKIPINKWVHCEKETSINKLASPDIIWDSGAHINFYNIHYCKILYQITLNLYDSCNKINK